MRRASQPLTYLDARLSVVHDDAVSEVGGHDEVVFYHEGRFLGVKDKSLDQLRARDALRRHQQQRAQEKKSNMTQARLERCL